MPRHLCHHCFYITNYYYDYEFYYYDYIYYLNILRVIVLLCLLNPFFIYLLSSTTSTSTSTIPCNDYVGHVF